MKAFIPNVVSLIYLNATKKLTPEKLKLGEEALRTGVQQALETRISVGDNKGAFSIWGKKSRGHSDSIWLVQTFVNFQNFNNCDFIQVDSICFKMSWQSQIFN